MTNTINKVVQNGTEYVFPTDSKIFPRPDAWDSVSDIVAWLWEGKVAILNDWGILFQVAGYNPFLWLIRYSYIHHVNATDYLTCYTIYYNTSTLEVDTMDDRDYILVPRWWTNGQVLTATSSETVAWQNAPATWIQNDTTWTTTTVGNIWAWSESEYSNLSSYDASTIYYVF